MTHIMEDKGMGRNFAEALTKETNWGKTWNGQDALKSTESALLDFYASLGTYRGNDCVTKATDFDAAFSEDALLAMKALFYCRDARGGLGERQTFRDILAHAGNYHTDAIVKNMSLIPYFGRFDDLYALVGTKAEDAMWEFMSAQFEADVLAMKENKPASLLAKWIKTPDSANEHTAELGKLTAKKLGYARNKMPYFKKTLKELRRYIGVVEPYVYGGTFDCIDYSKLPGMAMLRYKTLFNRKDSSHFEEYLKNVSEGKNKINTNVVTPYDIVKSYIYKCGMGDLFYNKSAKFEPDTTLEEMWRNLPNYVDADKMKNALVVCDTSESMESGRLKSAIPLVVALSLTFYSAERNTGVFKDKFISFSSAPNFHTLYGDTLLQRLLSVDRIDWGKNTNIEAVMRLILRTAKKYQVAPEDMPESIVIISDMQFDKCAVGTTFIKHCRYKFKQEGYKLPNVIFWNVNSQSNTFHADANRKGVQLLSGHSATTFKTLLANLDKTPYEAMLATILSDRYAQISVKK